MKVVIVYGESDWEGLYVDGHLKWEDHTITARDILEVLEIDHEYVHEDEIKGSLEELDELL